MNGYKYKLDEVLQLPVVTFRILLEKLMEVEAQQQLQQLQIVGYPHMKRSAQTQLVQHLKRLATQSTKKSATISQIAEDRKRLTKFLKGNRV